MKQANVAPQQSILVGTCTGTIDVTTPFNARLVELSDATYPPPHGEAHFMLATQRAPAPDYTTKEFVLSLSKASGNGRYGLAPDFYAVRILFIDNSDPQNPIVYTQYSGVADVNYDAQKREFRGEVSAVVENTDEPTRKTLHLRINFHAIAIIPVRRIPRRYSPGKSHCSAA